MENEASTNSHDVEESEEENVLAVHYPKETKKLKIKFRDSALPTSSRGQSVEIRRERGANSTADNGVDEERAEERDDEKLPSQDNNLDIRHGVYKCCVYLCASVICFTIMIGIVAVGYVFHLGS